MIRMCFQACSRNPIGIDRDPLLLVSLSKPMKLKEPPGEIVVELLGHTPNSIFMAYGLAPWNELRHAVKLF